MKPSVTKVYQDFIWDNTSKDLARILYNTPPTTLGSVKKNVPDLLKQYQKTGWHSEERMKQIQKILEKVNKDMGCLTPKVKKNIETLSNGAIESAHQSVVMGGPTFILNKASTAERIATYNSTEDTPLAPFFFVADYDIVQNELTHMRTPIMGS
ncbi:MAG: bacillithiol biosynthesis protein BshC, partial [Candidatus Thorarchaeota archaeon]